MVNSLDFSCKHSHYNWILTFTFRLPTVLELNASENMKTEDKRRMHKAADSNLLVVIVLKDDGFSGQGSFVFHLAEQRVNDHF